MKSLIALGLVMEVLAGVIPPQVTAAPIISSTDVALPYSTICHRESNLTVTSSSSSSTIDPTETIDWLQRPETRTYIRDTKLYAQTTLPTTVSTATVPVLATPKWGAEPIRNPKTGVIPHAIDVQNNTQTSGVAKIDTTEMTGALDESLILENLKESWENIKSLASVIKSKDPFIGDTLIPSPDESQEIAEEEVERKYLDESMIPEELKEAWGKIKILVAAGIIKSKGPFNGDLLILSSNDPQKAPEKDD